MNFFCASSPILFNLTCTFAAHLEKAFVPSVLVRSLLITSVFDNLEYKKKMIVLENILNYGFKICMNPAINETT